MGQGWNREGTFNGFWREVICVCDWEKSPPSKQSNIKRRNIDKTEDVPEQDDQDDYEPEIIQKPNVLTIIMALLQSSSPHF